MPLKWINILHLYQPPTQSQAVINQVVHESYSLITNLLRRYQKLRLTANLSGSLIELLNSYGHQAVLEELKRFAKAGRIELLGSAMYHPILPLLPPAEVERQIRLHDVISRKCFQDAYQPRGFYLPEMAYSDKVAAIIKKAGFEWLALDEIHLLSSNPNPAVRYQIKGNDLTVIFRDQNVSKHFPPEFIIQERDKIKNPYLITVHDGELYGHWHKDDRGYYARALSDKSVETVLASDYVKQLGRANPVKPSVASWESTEEELGKGVSFALWNDPRNKAHVCLNKLKQYALKVIPVHTHDPNYTNARVHLDRGLASCAWWWASGRKLGAFSPLAWNPEEIEKGARELLTAVRSLHKLSARQKIAAENLFMVLYKHIWTKHWELHGKQAAS